MSIKFDINRKSYIKIYVLRTSKKTG